MQRERFRFLVNLAGALAVIILIVRFAGLNEPQERPPPVEHAWNDKSNVDRIR